MAQQVINVDSPNSGNGDELRAAFVKVNANFTEVYADAATIPRLRTAANDAARLALTDLRAGDFLIQTDTEVFWTYNGSSWVKGSSQFYNTNTPTTLAAITGMKQGDIARITTGAETGDVYVFDGTAWQQISASGGGGGDSTRIEDGDSNTFIDTDATADHLIGSCGGTQVFDFAAAALTLSTEVLTGISAGLQSSINLLGIPGITGTALIAQDTRSGTTSSYVLAGESIVAGGTPQQACLGLLNGATGALAEFCMQQHATNGTQGAMRIFRNAGDQMNWTLRPDSSTFAQTNGGTTGTLTMTPTLLTWDKELTLSAFPSTRDDGATSKALYVGTNGELRYGDLSGVGSLEDSDADSTASFPSDDVFRVTIGGANTAQADIDGDGIKLTSGELEFLTNSTGILLRTATGVRARLILVDDATQTDNIRLDLSLAP